MVRRFAKQAAACWLMMAIACLFTTARTTPAVAQTAFPEKPITLIVPFPPGGAGDIFGRLIAGEMQQRLGKPVIVLNRPGAGTAIAAREVANAAPDGYTILSGSNSTFVFPHAIKDDLPYDSVKQFDPIGILANVSLALNTFSDHPVKDVAGLVAAAKAAPGKLPLASYGGGTISHFAGEMFKTAAGIQMVHIAYKGSAPAMQDLIGKQVAFLVDTTVATKPRVEEGKVRALAVFSGKRSAFMPDTPTLAELGFPEIDLKAWLAFALPKGVPAEVRAKLIATVADVMKSDSVVERLSKLGYEPAFQTIDDWPARIARDIAAMKEVAQKAGIKADD